MKQSQVKMTVARHNSNEIVSINDKIVVSGKDCGCTCLDCGAVLVARKKLHGKRAYHFAHYANNNSLNCKWTGESELHFRVKEYLSKTKSIDIPIGYHSPRIMHVNFKEVLLEQPLLPTKRIPDVIGVTDSGERIIFEVRVMHEVDKQKRYDYRISNVTAVEIMFDDVHSYLNDDSVISDDLIYEHLRLMPFEWLSIGPSGEIADSYHNHEREQLVAITKNVDLARKNGEKELDDLVKEISRMNQFFAGYEKEYNYKKSQIVRLEGFVEDLTMDIKHLSVDKKALVIRNQAVIDNVVSEFKRDIAYENELVVAKSINDEIDKCKYEIEVLYQKKDSLNSTLKRYNEELERTKGELEHNNELLKGYNEKLLNFEKDKLELENSKLEHKELVEMGFRNAKKISDLYRNLKIIEDRVRPLCSKFGIPWPFSKSLTQEVSSSDENL